MEERYTKISSSLKIFKKSHIISIKANNEMIFYKEALETEKHSIKILRDNKNTFITEDTPKILPL